jgi:hypothetical protein
MARRKANTELQVRARFEAARTGAHCLAAAYERLVPIPHRLLAGGDRREKQAVAVVAAASPQRRRVERG